MGGKIRRRSVYLATGVAILAMVAGFAMASGGFLSFGTTTVRGNQGAVSTAGTIYDPGISGFLFFTGATTTCEQTSTATGSTTTPVATAWVAGAGTGACAGGTDYVLQLNFTSNLTLGVGDYKDTFTISSEFGTSPTGYTTESVTVLCDPTASPASCQADINIDTGVLYTSAQPAVDGIDVSVTGS